MTVTFARFGQLVAGAVGSSLTTAALTFKLAFTEEDSPELLSEFLRTIAGTEFGGSLVVRARIVFGFLAGAVLYTIVDGFKSIKRPNRKQISLEFDLR